MESILVVDDELKSRTLLKEILEQEGYKVFLSEKGLDGINTLASFTPTLILLDLRLPDMDGLKVLEEIRKIKPSIPVIIISAFGTVDSAVKAIKYGAYDFLEKPLDTTRVLLTVENTIKGKKMREEIELLKVKAFEKYRMLGSSPAIQKVYSLIEQASKSKTNVLLTGESGTGKELAARGIHLRSESWKNPFVGINCAAIPKDLIESELFGYEKGAFTGANIRKKGKLEIANEGTFFLDEIGDMSVATQSKLLRFLEEKEFERLGGNELIKIDTRIIAASNKNLKKEIEKNNFREDLYYRLCVICIDIPPLRERRTDIPKLVDYFLTAFS